MIHNPSEDEVILESTDLCQSFFDQLGEDLSTLEADLIDLGRGQRDPDVIRRTLQFMHSSKGTAGALSYIVISKAFHQMEDMVIAWQKEEGLFNLDFMLDRVDLVRRTMDLSQDASLSRAAYLEEYEKLRAGLRRAASNKPRILIIDSFQATLLLMKEHLDKYDLDVMICSDGYQGLGKVLHDAIDGVVCGGMINGIDGPALIAAIKLNPSTSIVKTALITSKVRPKLFVEPDQVAHRTEKDLSYLAKWFHETLAKDQMARQASA
ncbi:Hpt domain-containing protein [Pseudobacteriovorax antillogorgiicola]|uniref:Hpt domain-containing protein n=1 Tax=Pseudobacteriovorax antillogorgiicola TaxID=1513793 RepID=A0A1Y6BF57_9BACT|nr:Hpt domain-containing protein [Pseudobacteriovorax antillogorgiicola]TCS56271.1 Hpt domain-containing protein [Pseudobacteriovorax antillogorgiicola]SMF07776.1 Hpt domain-containing protein [Pseudobacteriovorax antillogorgiicola]